MHEHDAHGTDGKRRPGTECRDESWLLRQHQDEEEREGDGDDARREPLVSNRCHGGDAQRHSGGVEQDGADADHDPLNDVDASALSTFRRPAQRHERAFLQRFGDDLAVTGTARPEAWRCVTCGEEHEGLATVFGPSEPDLWASATDSQRERGEINSDMCVLPIDNTTHYFIRGELQLPVRDAAVDVFAWSVWVSLSAPNMKRTVEHWDDPARAALPPMFGWLCNWLTPYDPPTTNLAVNVHTRAPGTVPLIQLDPSVDHPLVREQVDGITLHRVAQLNRLLLAG